MLFFIHKLNKWTSIQYILPTSDAFCLLHHPPTTWVSGWWVSWLVGSVGAWDGRYHRFSNNISVRNAGGVLEAPKTPG